MPTTRPSMLLVATLATLVLVLLPAGAASAHPAQRSPGTCPGVPVDTLEMENDAGTVIAEVVLYWYEAGGYNCARTNHRGPSYDRTAWTSVTLYACRETSPSSVCHRYGSDGATDSGQYSLYAGRVFVNARNRCIHIEGNITWANTAHHAEILGASHCD